MVKNSKNGPVKRLVFISTRSDEIEPLLVHFNEIHFLFVQTIEELEEVFQLDDILMAHNTSQIVPKHILQKASIALNVHAGPPDFPGRDPHHWAVYFGSAEYGVTAHLMEERVDAGRIIDVLRFPIKPNDTPNSLLKKANDLALGCIVTLVQKTINNQIIFQPDERWSTRKMKRKDFLAKCDVTQVLHNQEEMKLRMKAFQVPGRQNLYFMEGTTRVYLPKTS